MFCFSDFRSGFLEDRSRRSDNFDSDRSVMAEEHRCQAPEGHRLCANSCGFFGSPATMNLCSKCYRDFCLKEQQHASMKSTVEASLSSSSSPVIEFRSSLPPPPLLSLPEVAEDAPPPTPEEVALPSSSPRPNRCNVCRKRVGLTGFRCKCAATFCGVHRYPEKHSCSFDFKTVGKEEIARSNPLIKAEKLDKI